MLRAFWLRPRGHTDLIRPTGVERVENDDGEPGRFAESGGVADFFVAKDGLFDAVIEDAEIFFAQVLDWRVVRVLGYYGDFDHAGVGVKNGDRAAARAGSSTQMSVRIVRCGRMIQRMVFSCSVTWAAASGFRSTS